MDKCCDRQQRRRPADPPAFAPHGLQEGRTTHLLLAHKSPVSALALLTDPTGTSERKFLLSAGWDKYVHFWDIGEPSATATHKSLGQQRTPVRRCLQPLLTIPDASNDFIKALHVLPPLRPHSDPLFLLSGGSDRLVKVWNLAELSKWVFGSGVAQSRAAPVPRCIGVFSEHTRGVTSLTSLPPVKATVASMSSASPRYPTAYSADSMGRIFELSIEAEDREPRRAKVTIQRELRGPETTVSSLVAGWAYCDNEDDDGEPIREAQVWAASNDKTAQLFLPMDRSGDRSDSQATSRIAQSPRINQHQRSSNTGAILGSQPPLAPVLVIRQPDYVKAVCPLAHLIPENALGPKAMVVTSGSDEDIRVYDLEGDEDDGIKLVRQQQGHWHEVQWLGLWHGRIEEGITSSTASSGSGGGADSDAKECLTSNASEQWHVISTGLDGCIRRWPLTELLTPQNPGKGDSTAKDVAPSSKATATEATGSAPSNTVRSQSSSVISNSNAGGGKSVMTAEEEAELEELLTDE